MLERHPEVSLAYLFGSVAEGRVATRGVLAPETEARLESLAGFRNVSGSGPMGILK